MSHLLTDICQWTRRQPAWEQETLRRILAGEPFDDAAYCDLADWLVEGKGAVAVDLSVFEAPAAAVTGPRPVLTRIANVSNVNALAAGQSIEFGSALTAIFGANGAGKSGYARVFGNACFSRGDRDVLCDAFAPGAGALPQQASLTITEEGLSRSIQHAFGSPLPELAGFYVFDSTCVATHLGKANTLTFSPVGLAALQELVKHTEKVRGIVAARVDAACRPHEFTAIFDAATPVAQHIAALSARTDLGVLRELAQLSAEEEARAAELERELARLRLLDVRKAVRAMQTRISLLKTLAGVLAGIEEGVAVERLAELRSLLDERAVRKSEASRAGAEQFAVPGLQSVGSSAWSDFIQSARKLADSESRDGEPYPGEGARCLLCQQELSPGAAQLLHRLWEFLKGEAKRLLGETERRLATRRAAFEALHCNACEPSSAVFALLEEKSAGLLAACTAFLSIAECRRRAALGAIDGASVTLGDLPRLPVAPTEELQALAAQWEADVTALERSDPVQRITQCQGELSELHHRRLLAKHWLAIAAHVEQLKWAEATRKKIKSSKQITIKYRELFDERVTERYRQTFEAFLKKLGRPLRARIATRGQRGEAFKTLELAFPEGSTVTNASPQNVFSEGEKRAVALADFLTEVTLDPQAAGIVLDDPVTSLDAEWKETIACLLAEQARERQVIVFSHDLHFIYLLKNAAEKSSVKLKSHWIRRAEDGTPGYVYLDNSPTSEKDYKNPVKAKEYSDRAAKAASPEEEESLLKAGFGALRTTYEVFVLTEIFNGVVGRFDERIRMDLLKDAMLDAGIISAVIEKNGSISRFIEGHSHSDAFAASAPLCLKTLREEIDEFTLLKAKLRDLKKWAH